MSKPLSWSNETRTLSQLKPYAKNPRTLSASVAKRLKHSIEKSGYVEPIVIDADNTIVAGHQRYQILVSMYTDDIVIDVRVPSRKLTEPEFKRYLISSNKDHGDWDFDILADNFDVDDLLGFGFSETELGLFETTKQKEYKIILDDTPENAEFLDANNITYRRRSL